MSDWPKTIPVKTERRPLMGVDVDVVPADLARELYAALWYKAANGPEHRGCKCERCQANRDLLARYEREVGG